jgi:hypothetical protein
MLCEFKSALQTGRAGRVTFTYLEQTAVSILINNTERLAVCNHSMTNENSNAKHRRKHTSADIHTLNDYDLLLKGHQQSKVHPRTGHEGPEE